MIPEIMSEVLVFDSQYSWNWAFNVTLQQVRNGVEGKVDGTIRQRFD